MDVGPVTSSLHLERPIEQLRSILSIWPKDEMSRLKYELELLQAFFLHVVDEDQFRRERMVEFRELLGILYVLRSLIEDARARSNLVCGFLNPRLVYTFESVIEPITRRVREYILLQIGRTHLPEANEVPQEQLKKEVLSIAPKKFVGLGDEVANLISSLMEETEEVDVIAITGMPGIGKTKLASKIYHDNRIRNEFPTRIWVDVTPPEFRIKEPPEFRIKDIPEHGRYLLVIDGVWDADSLNEFINMLPKMGKGKVLLTSRNNNIIKQQPHVLRFLNEKESWDLLQLEVFGELDLCPKILKSTGECIATNCDGLPLAIAVVGTSLVAASSTEAAKDLTEKLWKAVSKNVATYLADYGQYCGFSSVELSYIELPQHLQTCFLYLGVFPQGHNIPVWTLIRLWIAEGFIVLDPPIHGSEGLVRLEEKAKQNLDDLINRNLVMIDKTYPNGHIKTCRLHKLIYGFCKCKAAEQDFYQEIKMSGTCGGPISLTPNCHRLCIQSHLSKFLSSTPKGQNVYSILCLNNEDKVVLHPEDTSTIHKCFRLLTVLECKYVNFTKFPNKLAKLKFLRYFSLSCDNLAVIPESISSLYNLETLVVDTQLPSLQLKANIWRMFRLRHLVTKAAIVLAIRGEGVAGEYLQTMTRLAPACCTADVFRKTPNLKTLGIRGHLATLLQPESLRKLEFLQHLKVINESAAHCQLHLISFFPPTLKRLTLSGIHLTRECMSILGRIDGLEILKLKNNTFMGESWTCKDAGGFRRLGFLLIGTTDLVSWEASPDCFPKLKCLVLNNCEKLQKIPSTLAKSLDTLILDNVSESAVESEREIKQEIARRRQRQNKRVLPSTSST